MLDRGEQLDWFASWEIWIEAGLAIAGAWMFVVHMLTAREPFFDRRMFADRNFATGLLFMAVIGLMLFAGLALLPPLLQGLFGYSVLQSGFLTAPRGDRHADLDDRRRPAGRQGRRAAAGPRRPRPDGAVAVADVGLHAWRWTARPVIVSGLVQGLALGLIFVPLNTRRLRHARARSTGPPPPACSTCRAASAARSASRS